MSNMSDLFCDYLCNYVKDKEHKQNYNVVTIMYMWEK